MPDSVIVQIGKIRYLFRIGVLLDSQAFVDVHVHFVRLTKACESSKTQTLKGIILFKFVTCLFCSRRGARRIVSLALSSKS